MSRYANIATISQVIARLLLIALAAVLASCGGVATPEATNAVQNLNPHLRRDAIVAFVLPYGEFRTALWPNPDTRSFNIRVITRFRTERLYDLPAPGDLVSWADVTDEWTVVKTEEQRDLVRYSATREPRTTVELQLPKPPGRYSLHVLRASSGREYLIFASLSEGVSVDGLFGYVTLEPPEKPN